VLLNIINWQTIPATRKPIGKIVFAVLAAVGTEALRRQTALEFPPPPLGADETLALPGEAEPSPVHRQPT
jgi:hypothetical protein